MTIQQQLAALLSGATDAGARVYPLTAPDGVVKPYVTYQRISVNAENVLAGASGLANTRVQIDVYAATYGEACAIASQVGELMAAWPVQNVCVLSKDFYEDPVKLFRVSADYSIWH